MRRLMLASLTGAALFLASADAGVAQERQWRFTPYAGGSVIGGDDETVEFENSFALGASVMYRIKRVGIEVQGQWIPTRFTSLVAFTESEFSELEADPFDDPVTIAHSNDQNLFQFSGNLVFFHTGWEEGAPPPPREWYGVIGAGITRFSDDHPARAAAESQGLAFPEIQGWAAGDSEFTVNFGVGLQLNLSNTLSIQFEVRDAVFKAVERNASLRASREGGNEVEKVFQHGIVFRQGITFLRF